MSFFQSLLSAGGVALDASVQNITSSTFNIIGTCSQGNVYCVVVVNGSGQPTRTQIKAGQNSGGTSAIRYNEKIDVTSFTLSFIGLDSDVPYDIYLFVETALLTFSAIKFLEATTTEADGLAYLTTSALSYYDFHALTGADASVITSVTDLGTLGIYLSDTAPADNPKLQYGQFSGQKINLFKADASSGGAYSDILLANTFGESWFKSDFEIIFTTMLTEGVSPTDFFGVNTGNNIVRFSLLTNAAAQAGAFRFEYRYSAATARRFVADSAGPQFSASIRTGLNLYRIRCDFTGDVFKVWVNGAEVSMSSIVDAFSLIDPTKWANVTNKVTIGSYNNGGTIQKFANPHYMGRFAVTPLMTDQEAIGVSTYMTLQ